MSARIERSFIVAVAAAWAVALASHAWGARLMDHGAAFDTGLPHWAAVGLLLAGWQVMVAAMMLPVSLPAAQAVAKTGTPVAGFLAGFALAWTGFGLALINMDAGVHRTVDGLPWLAAHPSLVTAGLLVTVGVLQLAPMKASCLRAARQWAPAHDAAPGRRYAVVEGARYGLTCIGCDGGLMLLMFGAGMGNVAWMVVVGLLMAAERSEWRPRRGTVSGWIGAALITSAVVVAWGSWL